MRISNHHKNYADYIGINAGRVIEKELKAAYAAKEVFVCEVQKWKGCTSP